MDTESITFSLCRKELDTNVILFSFIICVSVVVELSLALNRQDVAYYKETM